MTREEAISIMSVIVHMLEPQYDTDRIEDAVEMAIKALEQEPKTGHWEQFGNSWEDKFKCSECEEEQPKILCGERIIGYWSDYCPSCGAKMQ